MGRKQANDLTGQQFGSFTVLSKGEYYISPSGQKQLRWKCCCNCGNIVNLTTSQLKRGQKCNICSSKREDLTGRKFGKLSVLYAVDDYVSPKGLRMSKWHCICECGKEKDVLGMSLKNGDTKSCGFAIANRSKSVRTTKDYTGQCFGDLKVLYKIKDSKPVKYHCQCSCGKEKDVYQKDLTSGRKIHCRCKPEKKSHEPRPAPNYIGKQFDQVIIIEEMDPHITPNGSKQRIVKCQCSCGNEFTIRLTSIQKDGRCLNCKSKRRRADITGKRFGKLVVTSMAEDYISPSGHRLSRCNCHCDCGNDCIVNMSSLVTGSTQSCGCIQNSRGLLKDHPEYMKKYDFKKNASVDLENLSVTSNKKVWWKCEKCQNSWFAVVSSQTDLKKQHGCPYCSGRLITKGKNDLASQCPDMLCEWDYEKNTIQPDEIHINSTQKVWWKCKECGHSWCQTVANRVNNKSGCPKCNFENVNSFCEQSVYYYIKQLFPDAINGDKHIGMELDIFIPSLNVGIEYDGEYYHDSKKKIDIDKRKNELCIQKNIELIRIREPNNPPIDNCTVFFRNNSTNNSSLDEVIIEVISHLSTTATLDVNTTRDTPYIMEQFAQKKYNNSLLACYPDIAAEWHPTKNGKITPDKVSKGTRKSFWWLGKCGHEWQMSVIDRTSEYVRKNGHIKKRYGCPFCSSRRVLIGFNDLASTYPDIDKEWHPTKNGTMTSNDIMKRSTKKVWWQCSQGHEWLESPNVRIQHINGCPICYKAKRSPAVLCVETNQVFENASLAATQLGLKSTTSIYRCCQGKQKTTGGYHWKYADNTSVE